MLNLDAAITNSGNINVATGATFDINASSGTFSSSSSISGAGTITFQSQSGSIGINGNYNINGTTNLEGGSINFTAPIQSLGTSVVVNGASVNLAGNSVTVNNLILAAGLITGTGTITVNNSLEWDEGSMTGNGTTIAQSGVLFKGLTDADGFDKLSRTLNLYGSSSITLTTRQDALLYFDSNAALNIESGAIFNASNLQINGSDEEGQSWGIITNQGTLRVDDPNGEMYVDGSNIENKGVIQVANSTLYIISSTGQPGFNQDGGSTVLSNGTLLGSYNSGYNFNSGSLTGYGNIEAPVNNNGLIAPSGGAMTIYGGASLTLNSNSVLSFSLSGRQAGASYGQIINLNTTVGSMTLGGILQLTFANGFQSQVASSDTFTLIAGSSTLNGQFNNAPSGGRFYTADGRGSFLVNYNGNSLILSNFQPNSFANWQSVFFTAQQLSNPSIGGPTATPQKDGVPNLMKYLFDINPSTPMSSSDHAALPVVGMITTGGVPYLTLTYRKNPLVTGITVNVQTSTNLQNWQTVIPDVTQNLGSDPNTGDPIVEVEVNTQGVSREFIRLNVTLP